MRNQPGYSFGLAERGFDFKYSLLFVLYGEIQDEEGPDGSEVAVEIKRWAR